MLLKFLVLIWGWSNVTSNSSSSASITVFCMHEEGESPEMTPVAWREAVPGTGNRKKSSLFTVYGILY